MNSSIEAVTRPVTHARKRESSCTLTRRVEYKLCLEKGKFIKLVPRQRRVVLLLGELASELMPRTRVVLSLGELTMNSSIEAVTRPVTHARKRESSCTLTRRVEYKLCLEKGKFIKLVPRQRRVVLLLGELASELMPTRVVLSLGEFTMNSSLEAVTRPVTHARKESFPT